MKETAADAKLYNRALDRASAVSTVMTPDETMRRFMRRISLDAIMAFEDEVDAVRGAEEHHLRAALRQSREKFAFYADQHALKATDESLAKAEVNRDMVKMINEVLGDR